MKNFLNIIRYELVTGLWRFYFAIALTGVLSAKLWINYAQSDNHVLSPSNWDSFNGIWYGAMFMLSWIFISSVFHKNAFGIVRRDVILLPCNRWPKFWAVLIADVALPTLALFLSRYVALLTFDPQLIVEQSVELVIRSNKEWAFPFFANSLLYVILPLYWLFSSLVFRNMTFIKALLLLVAIFLVVMFVGALILDYCVDPDIYVLNDYNLGCWIIALTIAYAVGMVVAIKRRYERLEF